MKKRCYSLGLFCAISGLTLVFEIIFVSSSYATDFWCRKTGNWTDPTTWNQGANLPNGTDRTMINNASTVRISAGEDRCIAKEFWVGTDQLDGTPRSGYCEQTGGFLVISNYFFVGRNGANGGYDMSGGILKLVGASGKYVGNGSAYGATASMTLSGDALCINGGQAFRVGDNTPTVSSLNIRDSAVMSNNCEFWIGQYYRTNSDGSFLYHGTGTLNMEGGTLVLNGWSCFGRDNGEGTLNHSLGTINKIDANDFVVGHNSNGVGTLDINGGAIMNIAGSYFKLGNSTNTSTMRVYGNSSVLAGKQFWVGDGQRYPGGGHHRAVLDVSENGSINISNYFVVGRNNAIGVVNMTGGSITKLNGGGYVIIGSTSQPNNHGMIHQEGGNLYDYSGWIWIGENGIGVWDMWGGYAWVNAISVGENYAGYGVLTVGGTAELNATTVYMARNNSSTGTLNLAGGILSVNQILRGAGTGPKIINFNGGTLRAQVNTTDFIQNMEGIYVFENGMTIDNNGYNVTIQRQLNAPSGDGIKDISLLSGGAGYTVPPIVWITGGGGNGATAVAHIHSGTVTNIQIVSPGVGYTSTPDIFIEGGGGYDATIGTVTLGTSASGGLTKMGSGTLTLTATNTINGSTIVSNGTLSITTPWLSSSSDVYIYTPAQLNLNFTGTNYIRKFFIDGVLQASATYNSDNCSSITGTGCLRATASKGEGFVVLIY